MNTDNPRYIRSKLNEAVIEMTGREPFCQRVAKAWTVIHPIKAAGFKDEGLRADFEWVMTKHQFSVIEGINPEATEVECEEVRQRILKLHALFE